MEENAFWRVSRFEGTGAEAGEGGSEEHSGGLSRKPAKVRGFVQIVKRGRGEEGAKEMMLNCMALELLHKIIVF